MTTINRSLTKEYEFISSLDPAFEPGPEPGPDGELSEARKAFTSAYAEAMETGDFSKVPTKEGRTPWVWRLQHLASRHKRAIKQARDAFHAQYGGGVPWLANYKACRLGLLGVRGLHEALEDGSTEEFEISRHVDPKLQTLAVEHQQMDLIAQLRNDEGEWIGEGIINEIGLMVQAGGYPSPK